MCLDLIEIWHQRARPNPTPENFSVQLGCHLEEIAEMIDELTFDSTISGIKFGHDTALRHYLTLFADALKSGELTATIQNRKEFLDSLADQVVTAVGTGHCSGMKTTEACRRVNTSNWSKFDIDGQPIFNTNGKIAKGPRYAPPDLEGLT